MAKSFPDAKQQGFTLVELSIVLVIIGLIVGGVLVGQELIRAAELRTVITESRNILTSITAFRLKFNGLPGDIPNASTLWPSCDSTASWCNGNGDGIIFRTDSSLRQDESLRAWQQLSVSGLYPGSFTGIRTVTSQNDIGVNVPSSRFKNAGWFIDAFTQAMPMGAYVTNVTIGQFRASDVNRNYVLSPFQSQSIDQKIDDGVPLSGKVRGGHSDLNAGLYYWGNGSGFNGCGLSATNSYNTTPPNDTALLCILQFLL